MWTHRSRWHDGIINMFSASGGPVVMVENDDKKGLESVCATSHGLLASAL